MKKILNLNYFKQYNIYIFPEFNVKRNSYKRTICFILIYVPNPDKSNPERSFSRLLPSTRVPSILLFSHSRWWFKCSKRLLDAFRVRGTCIVTVFGQKLRRKHGHAENRTGIPRTRTIYGSNGPERWKFSRLLISPDTGARGCSYSALPRGSQCRLVVDENKMEREIWKTNEKKRLKGS